eukprot:COSAG03_NODE_4591_length_1499_cov_1.327857_2_plen_52_part_00
MGYRKLIERVDATYDKWFRHFQDVEAHLGPGWAKVKFLHTHGSFFALIFAC